jgi:hypothetical protein
MRNSTGHASASLWSLHYRVLSETVRENSLGGATRSMRNCVATNAVAKYDVLLHLLTCAQAIRGLTLMQRWWLT